MPHTIAQSLANISDPYEAARTLRVFYDPLGAAYATLPPAPVDAPLSSPPWAEFHPILDLRNLDHRRGWIHTIEHGWMSIGITAYEDLLDCQNSSDVSALVYGRASWNRGVLRDYSNWATAKTWHHRDIGSLWSQPQIHRGETAGDVVRLAMPAGERDWRVFSYSQWHAMSADWPIPMNPEWPLAGTRQSTHDPAECVVALGEGLDDALAGSDWAHTLRILDEQGRR